MPILLTERNNSAIITYSRGDTDHKFEVWQENRQALVEYQESCLSRGKITTAEPSEKVYKKVIQSDKLTSWMNRRNIKGVERVRPGPA